MSLFLMSLAGALVTSGCTLLVDRSGAQCATDDDCAKFGSHPFCRQGVCVPSGLGPPGCFAGTPEAPSEFANACSTSVCEPFDNCARLGNCVDGGSDQPLMTPANLGTVPAPVNQQTAPTVSCADPSRPNLIYVTGSTNFPPLLAAVAPLLAQNNPPYQVVFAPQTSCKGAGSMYDSDPTKHIIKDVPGNWAFLVNPDGSKTPCLLGASGATVDVGESDVYAQTCSYNSVAGVADYTGPIQAITFVVPATSSQHQISAEAAHGIFGAGGMGGKIKPWIDPTLYFVRSWGTGTIQMPSRAINVPATAWWGIDRLSADNLVASLEIVDPSQADKAIGVLSSDFADRARDNLRTLMFQADGAACAYLPDSAPTSFDKANVRDGHYPIWGPIHLFTINNNSVPSLAAGALVTRFAVPRLDQGLLDAIVGSGYIPQCAMRVQRTQEMGPMASYQPQFGCGCYFEAKVNGKSTCKSCSGPGDCPSTAPACNYGYCEVQ
jgi:ABC-type phosphate transport system substrate-binding protein